MEINALRWSQVDLKRNRITLMDTKNEEPRVLAFEKTVSQVLQKLLKDNPPKHPNDLVFPSSILPSVSIEIKKPSPGDEKQSLKAAGGLNECLRQRWTEGAERRGLP